MSPRSCLLRCAGLALLLEFSLSAQTPVPSAPPLQQQIDELRTELRELKALLQERSARMEAPIAPKRPEVLSVNVHGEPFRGSALAQQGTTAQVGSSSTSTQVPLVGQTDGTTAGS